MKNKLSGLIFLAIIAFLFSGCSILPDSLTNSGRRIIMPGDIFSPLEDKVIVGSLWKTSDGGHSFMSKSILDKAAVAALEAESKKNNQSASSGKKPDDGKNQRGGGTIDNSAKTKSENEIGDLISTADILSIAFHPTRQNIIYISTANDGLFLTTDGGELWKPIPFPPKNVYSFIIDKNDPDNRMFASGVVGDFGKIFRTKDTGKNWEEVYTEPGDQIPVTGLAQHIMDANVIFAGTKTGTVAKSIDAGDTWKNVGQLEDYWDEGAKKMIIGQKITGNVTDFAFDAKAKSSLYLVTYGSKLYYSRNTGDRWLDWELEKEREVAKMQRDKVDPEKIKAYRERMAKERMPSGIDSIAADPLIAGTVYAGTQSGFFVSTSYGKWWKELNLIESAKRFSIRSIAINPKKSSDIVFVAGRAFYKSTDSGKTWEVVGLDVNRGVSFVAYDPFDSNNLFVGLRKFD